MIEIFYQMWDVNIAIAMFAGILGGLMHGFTGWGGAMIMMPIVTLVYGLSLIHISEPTRPY